MKKVSNSTFQNIKRKRCVPKKKYILVYIKGILKIFHKYFSFLYFGTYFKKTFCFLNIS